MSLPWSVLSWFWLGSAVPDTMVIKLGEGMGDRTFANGLYYFFEAYPFAVTASLIPPVVGVLVLLGGWRRGAAPVHLVLGVGGLLHAGTYLLLGTAPYQWYYGPAIGALTMLGAVGARGRRCGPVALGAAVATVALTAVYLGRPPLDAHDDLGQLGHAHRVPRAGRARRPRARWCSRSARWARWPTTAPAR